jgi:hypothetical protein
MRLLPLGTISYRSRCQTVCVGPMMRADFDPDTAVEMGVAGEENRRHPRKIALAEEIGSVYWKTSGMLRRAGVFWR